VKRPFHINTQEKQRMFTVSSGHRRLIATGGAALLSVGLIFSAQAQNTPAPGGGAGPSPSKLAVESRRAIYTLIGNYFRPFGAIAKGAASYDEAEATKRAARITFLASLIGENFPEGSNVGEPDSKAKADIWKDRADFEKKLKDFQEHAANLVDVNAKEKGATDAWKAAVAALGQDCKGCHDSYKLK
jgi:cytochrome c556